jgi:predicted ATPase/serine/threonine protein kinase
MGEVYLARDTRLDREVALKLLPDRMAHDAEAIARFRHEALTLASLNHPNLATVYGFEEIPRGPMALVLERVEGETLAERLRRGPLAVPDALQICAQIALGLEVAHEHGVIHRDVKPANVMIGPRGLVKVLDFGLAQRTAGLDRLTVTGDGADAPATRVVAPAPAINEAAPTLGPTTSPAPTDGNDSDARTVTASGMTVGTPGYMSPEQVVAGPLDERTDVFALGCVLYECLTGRRAFTGRDAVEIMRSTLNDAVDPTALPELTPSRVRTLLARCLRFRRRVREIAEVRRELEDVLGIRRAAALREGGADHARRHLPAPATTFVGRETTLTECSSALERTRILSLVGMGGSGKTRLALQLAESRVESFPDGVWFVDVAPLAEPERVVEVLAAALDVRDDTGRTLQQGITEHLATRHGLVLLDNAESQIAACARLAAELARDCPDLKLLVTTREPLGIEGETVYTVPALGLPAVSAATAAEVSKSEAVRLFVERARLASPDFELTDHNARAVVEICRRLDGVPLALELAAARVRLLDIEQIRARLGDRFKLLARGAGAPARQQTVLATIQWSFDHLLPPEQDLMRRLAVFTGGWTLERAARVCSDTGDEFEVLDLLTRLAERLLVVVDRSAGGAARYRFLESVWSFASDQLKGRPEHDALRERHLAVFLAMAEEAEIAMMGPALPERLTEMAAEEENLLAALAWCQHAMDGVERGLRLAASASRLWSVTGRYATGRRVIEEALARDSARRNAPLRSKALARAAGFALHMGDAAAARRHLEEGLALDRATGDLKGTARTLGGLSVIAMNESRLDEAWALCEESMAAYRELGVPRGVAMSLHNMGTIEWVLGRPDLGRARFEAALDLLREVGDAGTEALCLGALSATLSHLGEPDAARGRLLECLTILETMDAPREGMYALDALSEWLLATGRPSESARMAGAAETARVVLGVPTMPHERVDLDRARARMMERLGSGEAERARAEGRTLTLRQALEEARTMLDSPPSSRP